MISNAALLLKDHYFDPPLRLVVVLDEESFVWTQRRSMMDQHQSVRSSSPLEFEGAFLLPRSALESSIGSRQVLRELTELMDKIPSSTPSGGNQVSFTTNQTLSSKMTLQCPSPIGVIDESISAEGFSSIPHGSQSKLSQQDFSTVRSLPCGLQVAHGHGVSSICLSFSFGRCSGRSRGDPTTCVQAHVNPLVSAALRAFVFRSSVPSHSLSEKANSTLMNASPMEFFTPSSQEESQRSIRTAFCRTLYANLTDNLLKELQEHLHDSTAFPSEASAPSFYSDWVTPSKDSSLPLHSPQTPPTLAHRLTWSLYKSSHETAKQLSPFFTPPQTSSNSSTSRQLFSSTPLLGSVTSQFPQQDSQEETFPTNPLYLQRPWHGGARNLSENTQAIHSLRATPNFLTVRSSFLLPTVGWLHHEAAYRVWLREGFRQELSQNNIHTKETFTKADVPYSLALFPEPDEHPLVKDLVKAFASHSLEHVSVCLDQLLPSESSTSSEGMEGARPLQRHVQVKQGWGTQGIPKTPMWVVNSHDDVVVPPCATHQHNLPHHPSPSSALFFSTKGIMPHHHVQRFTQGADICPSFAIHQDCSQGQKCNMLHIHNLDKASRSFRKTELRDLLCLIRKVQHS